MKDKINGRVVIQGQLLKDITEEDFTTMDITTKQRLTQKEAKYAGKIDLFKYFNQYLVNDEEATFQNFICEYSGKRVYSITAEQGLSNVPCQTHYNMAKILKPLISATNYQDDIDFFGKDIKK